MAAIPIFNLANRLQLSPAENDWVSDFTAGRIYLIFSYS